MAAVFWIGVAIGSILYLYPEQEPAHTYNQDGPTENMPSLTPSDDTTNENQDQNESSKKKKSKLKRFFFNQKLNNQVVHYQSKQLNHSPHSSTGAIINTVNSTGVRNAQQIAYDQRIIGSDIALIIRGKRVMVSRASVSAFCNDYLNNELAKAPRLTAALLDDLASEQRISIYHSEKVAGNILKKKFAAELAKVAISAGVIAAVNDFSQFKDIIDTFFKYEYSDTITSHDNYSTHYYANDEYTVTGCFLSKTINKKDKTRKFALVRGNSTDIEYEAQCYLFTFKVAQAAKFLERHLSR